MALIRLSEHPRASSDVPGEIFVQNNGAFAALYHSHIAITESVRHVGRVGHVRMSG